MIVVLILLKLLTQHDRQLDSQVVYITALIIGDTEVEKLWMSELRTTDNTRNSIYYDTV